MGGSTSPYFHVATPLEQGMTFADLNGNLQIADQTSVAIDPVDRHGLHSSQTSTGWSATTGQFPGSLQWNSTNLAVSDGLTAGYIRAGRRDPNAGPGAQSNIYRTYSFHFIGVTASIQGSQFQPVNQGLDVGFVPASLQPPLVVNPTKLAGPNGTFFDEIMYGTNKVFESDNNAASWDQVANLLPNDVYTAMAFGPSGTDVFYVGTEGGQVFVDLRDGGDGFPNRTAGLLPFYTNGPVRINGITVDPNDPKTAYVMTSGAQDNHVFKTTDAGVTWTSVSAGLPKVPAYSMAIDRRPSPGAPNGKLFLGTDVGVYVSLDGGATWAKFGQGLPNVPAVDLQFDQVWETLAIATLGRGTFEISTARFGPRVVSVIPPGPTAPGISSLFVNFNQPMDPRTFTTDTIRIFNGPNGPITPLQIIDLDPFGDHMRFQINFVPQTSDGVYTISIAPRVTDLVGNPMDQDGNGINGEDPGDIFTTRFVVNSTDDGRIVTGFYHDLLGRTADTDGFLSFLGVIDSVRFQLLPGAAVGFAASNEARRARIFNPGLTTALTDPSRPDLYPHYLRRSAAGPEIDFWSQALNFGATPEAIVTLIAASDEYYQQALVGGIDSGFIDQLYLDVLGRQTRASQADPAGFNGFVGSLALSEENIRRNAVTVVDHSSEYFTTLVNSFYTKYLGRPASPGELPNWIGQLQLGTLTDESLIAILVSSDENFARRGSDNVAWLTGAFNDILGRAPDPSGFNLFLGQLQSGRSRFSVASQLLASDEYRRNLVQSYFTKFLGRSADEGAFSVFVGAMRLGLSDEAIISILVASNEYFQKQRGTATTQQALDVNWVNGVYNDVLGRPADAGGGASFLALLAAGERTARIGIVQIFVGSAEYRANLVTTTYQSYLGRTPGIAEIAIWQPLLQQPSAGPGTPNADEQFLGIVTGSFEYFMRQRGPDNVVTNTTWFTSLYRNILGRAPDAPGLDANLNAVLNQYQTQRLNSATVLDTSTEYRQNLVNTLFKTYLRRAPLANEVTQRVTDLSNGLTDEQLIGLLVSSVEYFQNPNLGGADNSKWLNQVFLDLLGRNRDASAQPLLDALNNNSLTRAGVVTIIMGGDEFGKRLVNQFFTTYLGRAALPAEQTQFLGSLRAGATDEQIIANLLASNEYAKRPHAFP
jgi:hypothetical protein